MQRHRDVHAVGLNGDAQSAEAFGVSGPRDAKPIRTIVQKNHRPMLSESAARPFVPHVYQAFRE